VDTERTSTNRAGKENTLTSHCPAVEKIPVRCPSVDGSFLQQSKWQERE